MRVGEGQLRDLRCLYRKEPPVSINLPEYEHVNSSN
jgi:hypothetical protein